eukprot:gene57336-biopygen96334
MDVNCSASTTIHSPDERNVFCGIDYGRLRSGGRLFWATADRDDLQRRGLCPE